MQRDHPTVCRDAENKELNDMKTFKFKLYRSKKTRRLDHQLWVACKVYNHAIALHRRYWKLYHKSLSKFLARTLCKKYSIICLEDLNMKWMQIGHGKKVADYGFAELVSLLEYVSPKFGTTIVHIGKFFPSSQLCNACGFQNKEIKDVRIRAWDCPKCGTHHDRDRNAAKYIHEEGLSILSEEKATA